MKRMLVRLSLLTSVVVLGLIAIAQAQRGIDNPNVARPAGGADGQNAGASLNDDAPGPVALTDASTVALIMASNENGGDPFAGRGAGESTRHRGHQTPSPLPVHPLAAELDTRIPDPADDDFPSADEVLGSDHRRASIDSPAQAESPDGNKPDDGDLAIAQSPIRIADAGSDEPTPAPPATLPRYSTQAEERQPYNPVRGMENTERMVNPTATADRYGRPLTAGQRQPVQPVADPFPSRGGHPKETTTAIPGTSAGSPGRLPIDNAREGTGLPGAKQLEGQQVPTLVIHKVAPEEIQVGRPAIFEIRVQNTGTSAAHGVEVHDTVPKGTRLMTTTPLFTSGSQGDLIWELGTLDPGDEATVSVNLMPTSEGQIGSVASVRFSTEASVSTVATRPALSVEVVMADSVMIGEEISLNIRIRNTGSGVASNVIMEELVPDVFDHVKGSALEYEIGDLQPGETREVPLTLSAVTAGIRTNVISVRGDGNIGDKAENDVQVVAPAIAVDIQGPKRRFLDRNATYNISISNPGTAAAREIELVTFLPPGMEFVDANNQGQFDPATRAVYWLLEELPPEESGTVTLTAVPTEPGVLKLRVEGTAQHGLSDQHEQEITVEGVAAILFQVVDVEDPIEAGGETAYEIRVVNQGSKAATNVVIEAILPAEMKPLAADGPTRHKLDGQRVLFDPLPRLAPKADTTYLVRAQAVKPGDLRLMVRLRTDDMQKPVTKEESTRVFSDE